MEQILYDIGLLTLTKWLLGLIPPSDFDWRQEVRLKMIFRQFSVLLDHIFFFCVKSPNFNLEIFETQGSGGVSNFQKCLNYNWLLDPKQNTRIEYYSMNSILVIVAFCSGLKIGEHHPMKHCVTD